MDVATEYTVGPPTKGVGHRGKYGAPLPTGVTDGWSLFEKFWEPVHAKWTRAATRIGFAQRDCKADAAISTCEVERVATRISSAQRDCEWRVVGGAKLSQDRLCSPFVRVAQVPFSVTVYLFMFINLFPVRL